MFFVVLIISSIFRTGLSGPGLETAVDLLSQPFKPYTPTRDVVLSGNVGQWEAAAYKLNSLRTRLGIAWEFVFTDYGFERLPRGIDLINRRRKIGLELKNGWVINSMVKRVDHLLLKKFKREHPDYTVIFGHVNYKNEIGKFTIKEGVNYMYGNKFLRYIFQGKQDEIIKVLRRAVPRHVHGNAQYTHVICSLNVTNSI